MWISLQHSYLTDTALQTQNLATKPPNEVKEHNFRSVWCFWVPRSVHTLVHTNLPWLLSRSHCGMDDCEIEDLTCYKDILVSVVGIFEWQIKKEFWCLDFWLSCYIHEQIFVGTGNYPWVADNRKFACFPGCTRPPINITFEHCVTAVARTSTPRTVSTTKMSHSCWTRWRGEQQVRQSEHKSDIWWCALQVSLHSLQIWEIHEGSNWDSHQKGAFRFSTSYLFMRIQHTQYWRIPPAFQKMWTFTFPMLCLPFSNHHIMALETALFETRKCFFSLSLVQR